MDLDKDDYNEEKYLANEEIVKGYLFDFCYKDSKLIEFNGDYWHVNPKIYNENSFIKAKNKNAKQIWEYDKQKTNTAISQGFEILII